MSSARPQSIKALALEFLVYHTGTVVSREDIEKHIRDARGSMSAGEVTRRIRDLKQEGWQIETSATHSELKPGEYRLASITKSSVPRAKPRRSLDSLIAEILDRPESDLREIRDVLERRLGPPE